MEFVIGIVSSIFTKAAEYTISPIINHVKYLSNHQQNVETLKDKAEKLKDTRDRVQHSVDAAERNGKEIEGDVDKWLSAVDRKITEQVEKVMQDEEKAKKKCFIGLCPNFWTRYKHSLKAAAEAKAVAELLEQGKFDEVSYPMPLQGIAVPPVKGYEDFESRTLVLNGIMEALNDDSVSVIGVHGMGGIGKTMLVKEIARKVKGNLFDSVVIATVNQAIDIEKIQNRIAELLEFEFKERSTDVKALRLRERLKKEKRVLVVLDDIWEKVDIEEVGIPLGDEHKGCKLLLTSRELNVLSNGMDAQKHFSIRLLNEKEAWDLFKKKAGDCVESCDLKPTAMEVAKKCAGLPIAIATVAEALRNKRLFEWKDALRELERPSSSNLTGIAAAYSAIEWSFNYLKSEEVKLTFLLCCVIGHNGLVEKLMRYTVGLGLFRGVNTVEEARNKVLTAVANLKASSLLLDSYDDEHFDIHDVVWDAALAIASKDYHMLVLRDHIPKEWSDKAKMNSLRMISLPCPQIVAELPREMEYSGLSFFHMAHDDSVAIPPDFFGRIKSLEVLDLPHELSFTFLPGSIIHLPGSIINLINLRMLCLRGWRVEDITIIGELKNLEILDLAFSRIKELPKKIEQLTQLKLLDLSRCIALKIIPPNVLSSLSKLEELYMGGSFAEWENEGVVDNERRNARLDELNKLSRLTTLHVKIPDVQMIPKHGFIETLDRYKVLVGDYNAFEWYSKYECSRTLKLKIYKNISSNNGMKMLLKRSEYLYLDLKGHEGIKSVLAELNNGEEFSNLKRVDVIITMEEYSTSSEPVPVLFNKQTSLWISKLRRLIINGCGNLEHLLSPSVARSLVQLHRFEIVHCESLREIIFTEEIEEEEEMNNVICFPQLNFLRMDFLGNLISFCSGNYNIEFPLLKELKIVGCPKLKEFISESSIESGMHTLFNEKVAVPSLETMTISELSNVKMIFHTDLPPNSFQHLRELSVSGCEILKNLFPASIAKHLLQLEDLSISDCGVEEIVSEGKKLTTDGSALLMIMGLEDVRIQERKRNGEAALVVEETSLWISKLRRLIINGCGNLEHLLSPSVARSLVQLHRFEIVHCESLREIIFTEEIEEEEEMNNVICFPQLNFLRMDFLGNLISFCSGNYNIEFPLLKELKIVGCPKLKEFISESSIESGMHTLFNEKVAVPSLETMTISELSNVKMIFHTDLPPNSFQHLRELSVSGCEILKNLFPASIAKHLLQLEDLSISDCGVEEIVSEGKKLTTDGSALLMIMGLEDVRIQERKRNGEAALVVEEVIPNLEQLRLRDLVGDVGQFPPNLFPHIKVLKVNGGFGDGFPIFPFLRKICNLESLDLELFSFRDGLPCKGDVGTPSRIKKLNLSHLRNLQRMWRKDSELGHILSNLQTLTVMFCDDLINIGASSLSFKNLTTLKVSDCAMMTNLATPLIVESLVQLTTMEVSFCTKMTEIVANEGDYHQTIVVRNLKCLQLSNLESLTSFCPGSYTFNFLCLEEVVVEGCPKLKIFSEGVLSTPQLQSVNGSLYMNRCWAGDLNTTIQQLYMEEVGCLDLGVLTISDTFPELIEIWKKSPRAVLELTFLGEIKFYKCSSLKYIFTLSMLLSLKQLERINVQECDTMEQVIREDEEEATTHEFTFPKLSSVEIKACSNLTNFYLGSRALEFPKLSDIAIAGCPKMTAFSSSISRESEKVIGEQGVGDNTTTLFCDKVVVPSLETMTIFQLSNVKMIFQNDLPSDSFQNLRKLSVSGCESLKILFPASIVKHLLQLEDLSIIKCGVEEIVSEGEGVEEQPMRFEFPKVSSLVVEDLKELKCPYKGQHTILWPMLKTLSTNSSALLMIVALEDVRLMQERKGNGEAAMLTEQIIPNLEQLRLRDLVGDVGQFPPNLFPHIKVLKGHHGGSPFIFFFLRRFYNLKSLEFDNFDFKHVVPCEGDVGTPSPIKNLQLTSSKNLKHIWKKDSELGHILSNLQTLTIKNCDDLINLGASSLSFKNLTTLKVSNCAMMANLATPLIVESLVQLTTMEVSNCTKMTEIVANEGDYHQTIVVRNLKCLQLSNLESLTSFCPGSYTFNFLCLEEVVVEGCPQLKIFSEGVLSTPQLQSVKKGSLYMNRCWAGDLNTTIQQLYMEEVGCLDLGVLTISDTFPELIEIWKKSPRAVLELTFLGEIKLYKCSSLKYIFTLSMLLSLKQLERINVQECDTMEQVIREDEEEATTHEFTFPKLSSVEIKACSNLTNFYLGSRALEFPKLSDIAIAGCPKMTAFSSSISRESEKVIGEQGVGDNTTTLFCDKVVVPSLETMTIFQLSNVKMIFQNDLPSDSFQNLRKLSVSGCESLKILFPASIVKHLLQLEDLSIIKCGVEEIVSEGEGVEEQPMRFEFPKVSSLVVEDLKELKCPYKGQHTILWPMLKTLSTNSSALLMIVALEDVRLMQERKGNGEAAMLTEQIIPNLEQLRLRDLVGDVGQFPPNLFPHIKVLKGHHGGSPFIFFFLRRFYNLKSLEFDNFDFKHVVPCEGDVGTPSPIKNLQLTSSKNLKHIWKKDSELGHILSNLQTLTIKNCDDLINLGASSLSFKNLTTLKVSNCAMMANLATPLIVESLVQLTTMEVSNCTKMTEIVANEGDYHQTIVVRNLKCLQLSNLESLTSFCPGSYTFNFLCLEEVVVEGCPKLKIFSEGVLSTPQLQSVKKGSLYMNRCWAGDLNTTIQHPKLKIFSEGVLSTPQLQSVKKGSLYMNRCWAGDLNTTIQQLYMEEVGCLDLGVLTISDTFPELIEIWKKSPRAVLELTFLGEIKFYKCSSLKYIFTLSMLLSLKLLRRIEVKECDTMEQVIREDEEEATTHEFTFPKLSSVEIKACSNLTNFYLGSRALEFPKLSHIAIAGCPKMTAFSSSISRESEKVIGEQGVGDNTTTLFCDKVVIPNLKRLTLSSINIHEIWHHPSSSSLEHLQVEGCHNLKYIFTLSMLLSLKQLERINVQECDTMEQVIREDEEEATTHEFTFPELSSVEIKACSNLTNFYLGSRALEFPKLSHIAIAGCPKMTAFSSSISRESEKVIGEQGVGDNTTTLFCDKVVIPNLKRLTLSSINIHEIWHHPSSSSLEHLQVEGCHNLKYIFTLSMLLSLKQLERINVQECDTMEQVIREDEEEATTHEFTFPELSSVEIKACSNLTNFYLGSRALEFPKLSHIAIAGCPKMTAFSSSISRESEKVIGEQGVGDNTTTLFCDKVVIPNLKRLTLSSSNIHEIWHHPSSLSLERLRVEGCHNLKYIFTSSMLLSLKQLWWIEVKECNTMEQVIREDEEEATTHEFTFTRLFYVKLEACFNLTNFYLGSRALEFPKLSGIRIVGCPKMTAFSSSISRESEKVIGEQGVGDNTTTLFCHKDTFPVLQDLTLTTSDMMKGICDGQPSLCFPNLKLLNLQFFPETSTTLPYSFIRSLPKLQKLVINNASISELVRSEGLFHNEIHTSAFSQLEELSLSELPELTLKTLFEGLINEERHASACDQLEALRLSQLPELTLKTLEPFLLSFKNLLSMEVSRCHGFINLMACATAKSLTLLESLSIDDCEMIQEIIACEGEEIQGNIVFPKLKYLKLSCLPSLASFSLAHHLLEFPVLQTVKVKKCPKMKNFCQGELSTPRLEPAHLTGDEDGELQWEGDLNTSIKHMFDEMNVQNSQAVEVTDQLGSV